MTTLNVSRSLIAGAALALAITGLPAPALAAPPAAPAAPPAAPAAPPPAAQPFTVTLITGDRVTISRADATTASVKPAKGREHIAFATSVAQGHLRVIPGDAAALISAQKLDLRLFDITSLVADGFHDGARSTVSLIVQHRSPRKLKDATVDFDLPAVKGAAVSVRKADTTRLWDRLKSEAQHIWLDGVRKRTLDYSVPQIGAPAAWQAGFTGKGMKVAVLDTGVDESHPDLVGKVTSKNFTDEPDARDVDGHGTHVASTIAGTGAASNGKYKGVAPEATILNGKVCDLVYCPDSAILAGMQWAAVDQHAPVISMSLGAIDFPGLDPLEQAVEELSAQTGALFVIAAGNDYRKQTINSPASADAALAVAAVDRADRTADFSSRGSRTYDGAMKPDVSAPGVDIVAARSAGSDIGEPAPDFPQTYQAISGTSMATPHVAGAAALVRQQHPDWTGAQAKAVLMASAKPSADEGPFDQGTGRIDLVRALGQTLTSEPEALSFGVQRWPHNATSPVTKKLTYRNSGTAEVELNLTTTEEHFTLSAATLKVPAGGTASVTVTAETTGDVAPGVYSGRVIATGGTAQVSTSVGVEKEEERYGLTIRHIGLDGKPAKHYFTQIFQPTGDYFKTPYDPSGTITLRVPKGRYTLGTYLDTSEKADGTRQALIFQPVIELGGAGVKDLTITFDARTTALVSQAVPDATAVATHASLGMSMPVDGSVASYGTVADDPTELRIAVADPTAPGLPPMSGYMSSTWSKKDAGTGSPYAYFAAETVPGETLLSGAYRRTFTAAEMATETQVVHGLTTGMEAFQSSIAVTDSGQEIGGGSIDMPATGSRVNYYTASAGLRWGPRTSVRKRGSDGDEVHRLWTSEPKVYRAGEQGNQEWAAAPYGVNFDSSQPWFYRHKGTIVASVPQTGDAAGHVGFDYAAPIKSVLYRDGAQVGELEGNTVDAYDQPDEAAVYRVDQEHTGGIGDLATTLTASFTFRSARPATDDQTPLSIIGVRYTPQLDEDDTAHGPAGTVPLRVTDQAGRPVTATALGLEVSFDDGKTWAAAEVGADGVAKVTYPAGEGFVSVRMHAEQADTGAEATQTVVRAYRFSTK